MMMVTGMVLVPKVMLWGWWLDDSGDDGNDRLMIRCFTLEWNDPGVCCQVRWIKGEALDYTGDDYYDDYYDDFYATADADDAAVELFFLASIAVL